MSWLCRLSVPPTAPLLKGKGKCVGVARYRLISFSNASWYASE
ncbi:hypothetical protein [Salinibacter phage M8CC-19]|uniref:Uncharacterized protein n=2 Tax=Kryptosalinivirus M8CC19 TaxID=2560720 RepID=A0A2I6UGA9_9CAUD|nr:hypothetical protein FGG63_gp63 [Salinibacter phage M8CC-19]AUO79024.1 hypothetical protein [Salinibacter phage M8CC-19]AUO79257.1 hypothetical protein [Salinibacter phage M31CC-1]